MKLEYGKRYVTRKGLVSGPLEKNTGFSEFPFYCSELFRSFREDGTNRVDSGKEDPYDLVAEFVELPKFQWVNGVKPDKPGIWLQRLTETKYGAVCLNEGAEIPFASGCWCYLGPVPEIAPAKQRVTLRLYLEEIDEDVCHPLECLYRQHWVLPEDTPDPEWVETTSYRTEER